MILRFPTTSRMEKIFSIDACNFALNLVVLLGVASCASTNQETPNRPLSGTISYPFIGESKQIGKTKPTQPFVVRSAVGSREYTVEIPDNSTKYDIQIPIAELGPDTFDAPGMTTNARYANPANTDKELVSALPDLGKSRSGKTELLDAAFGVAKPDGPTQSPSYTLGIARINQHFKSREFELALVELNNLIAFYPNSPKLLKMKGTLLVKTGNRELAMKSWQRALDLAPSDSALKMSINRLNERILAEKNSRAINVQENMNNPASADPESLLERPAH